MDYRGFNNRIMTSFTNDVIFIINAILKYSLTDMLHLLNIGYELIIKRNTYENLTLLEVYFIMVISTILTFTFFIIILFI